MHGEFGKHPGTTQTRIVYGEKYFCQNMAKLKGEWVNSCEQCFRESSINGNLIRPPLHNPSKHITAPEDAM